jgi:hypothetical protein
MAQNRSEQLPVAVIQCSHGLEMPENLAIVHLFTTSLASTACLTCCLSSQCLWGGLKGPKIVLSMLLEELGQAQEEKSSTLAESFKAAGFSALDTTTCELGDQDFVNLSSNPAF